MFLVRASPSDLAVGEDGVATVVVEMKAEVAMGDGCWRGDGAAGRWSRNQVEMTDVVDGKWIGKEAVGDDCKDGVRCNERGKELVARLGWWCRP